jgi:hypothetical protein
MLSGFRATWISGDMAASQSGSPPGGRRIDPAASHSREAPSAGGWRGEPILDGVPPYTAISVPKMRVVVLPKMRVAERPWPRRPISSSAD